MKVKVVSGLFNVGKTAEVFGFWLDGNGEYIFILDFKDIYLNIPRQPYKERDLEFLDFKLEKTKTQMLFIEWGKLENRFKDLKTVLQNEPESGLWRVEDIDNYTKMYHEFVDELHNLHTETFNYISKEE